MFVSYGSKADQEQELKQGWVIIKGIVEDDADWTIIVNYIRAYAREAKIDCLMLRTNSYTRQMEKGYKSFILNIVLNKDVHDSKYPGSELMNLPKEFKTECRKQVTNASTPQSSQV